MPWPSRGRSPRRSRPGLLALALSGPQLLPLLEAIPRSAEYRARRAAVSSSATASVQSVPAGEAARRLLPDLLPFAHGIFGKSPVDVARGDGSGMPIGYAGAVLLPLAALALAAPRGRLPRGRGIFAALAAAGLAYGASAPGLMHLTERLPGFALALNYRLVFLAPLGLAGLAALGAASCRAETRAAASRSPPRPSAAAILAAAVLARPVFAARGLPARFVVGAARVRGRARRAARRRLRGAPRSARPGLAALVLLVGQRFLEMRGTYPTLPSDSLAPRAADARGAAGRRRPGARRRRRRRAPAERLGALRARGRPRLRVSRAGPLRRDVPAVVPRAGRVVQSRRRPRAAIPVRHERAVGDRRPRRRRAARLDRAGEGTRDGDLREPAERCRARSCPPGCAAWRDADRRLAEMAGASDFAATAWLSSSSASGAAEEENGPARLDAARVGPDLVIRAEATAADARRDVDSGLAGLDRPRRGGRDAGARDRQPRLRRRLDSAGRTEVRLSYRPRSVRAGLALFAAGAAACVAMAALGAGDTLAMANISGAIGQRPAEPGTSRSSVLIVLRTVATYAAAAALLTVAARRLVAPVRLRVALLLAIAPLLFTGAAILTGRVYAPVDLLYHAPPFGARRAELRIGRTGRRSSPTSRTRCCRGPRRFAAISPRAGCLSGTRTPSPASRCSPFSSPPCSTL